jgi:hypothetical protein
MQNSIFGVDIQPVACQIAKLRFFISLAIEQEANDDPSDNYGIKPLPNLETRFVAADTLLGLNKSDQLQMNLIDPALRGLQQQIGVNQERQFHAASRREKLRYRAEAKRLRAELGSELERLGMPAGDAEKVSAWDPDDQNAPAAQWFDAEYMFGVEDGFDVVIGNPPYVESRNSLLTTEIKEAYRSQVSADWGDTLPLGSDLLVYFYPRSAKFLKRDGIGCFITQNAWLSTDYGKKFQDFSLGRFSFAKIIDTSAKFFSDTSSQNINAVVSMFTKKSLDRIWYAITDTDMIVTSARTIAARQDMKWGHLFSMPHFFQEILEKMRSASQKRGRCSFGQGLNFSKKELNDLDATVPVIVDTPSFVATSADGMIRTIPVSRTDKVPALMMPRGVGNRHYCTFNLCKAYSYSFVEVYLPSELWETEIHFCLWAYLNSSLVWLFREITGRKNLGGGMLKAEATDMKALPINFEFDFAEQAKQVYLDIQNRKPLPVSEEVYTKEHLAIDDMVTDYLGFPDKADDIRDNLLKQVSFRTSRARSRS